MNRRNVLKTSSLAVGGLFFPSILLPKAKDKLGVALVGLGYYSTDLLAPGLLHTSHCELKGIVTGSPDKAANWQSKYNLKNSNIYNYGNFDTIANNPDIDIIYVVLPPSMHEEYVVRAAKAGKQVWCEKPMAVTAAECERMISACNQNKVGLSIGYRMQHEPQTQQIMLWAKSKPYGKMKSLSAMAGYRDNRTTHWKQNKSLGGGCMLDMGVYPLNAVRYTTGAEPVSVLSAKASTTRPEIYKEVEETMNFMLEFPNGVLANCETSFGKSMNTLEVQCKDGWYKVDPFQAYSGAVITTSDGKKLDQKLQHQQAKQMDDDALSIKSGKSHLVPGEEGLKDIRIVEAIKKVAQTSKSIKL